MASDVLASDKPDPEWSFRLSTQHLTFLTWGEAAPEVPDPRLPPLDSGTLSGYTTPDNLTITLSVGHSLFDERFGLTPQVPRKLQRMTCFPSDLLDTVSCYGDVLLQVYANTQDTVVRTLCDIIKHTSDLSSVCWKREGFISDHAAYSRGKETPTSLPGLKDDTVNPDSQSDKLTQEVVWVATDQQESAWTIGSSYQAVRLVQFRVGFQDRAPLKKQWTIFGRDKQTSVPLGTQHEHDVPDYASDSEGKVIALDSHIRLASPRTAKSESSLMLHHSYSYSLGVTNSGQLDMGLLLVCYQHNLEKGSLTVQKRLSDEALEEYVKPTDGGYSFTLPGVKDTSDYLGSVLLWV